MHLALDKEKLLLIGILLLALILRTYNFGELSLGNDELSVLARVQYDNFGELIEKGVKADVHPAGIQVFAYYWTNIFGESALALRFPFICCGLLGILGIYFLGKKWFGVNAALFSCLFMAATQYFIVLGVYARPYAVVLAASSWMVYCWHYMVFENPKPMHAVGMVMGASICLYFHYFSYLLLGIVLLSGLILLRNESAKRKNYLLSLGAIFILYLPHLSIFFHHLKMGGSEWMGKPGWEFIYQYFFYSIHFSGATALVILILAINFFVNAILKQGDNEAKFKFRLLALLFFLFPFVFGYLYSVLNAPVIHPNGLQASFPYLLLCFFSFIPQFDEEVKTYGMKVHIFYLLFLTLFLLQGLIFEREHYKIFYNRSAEFLVKEIEKSESVKAKETSHLLQVHHPYYADYYLRELEAKPEIRSYEIEQLGGVAECRNLFSQHTAEQISLAWLSKPLPPDFIPLLREFYPALIKRENRFISESYLFAKKADTAIFPRLIIKEDFEEVGSDWGDIVDFMQDSLVFEGKGAAFMGPEQVYGPTLNLKVDAINLKPFEEIWIRLPFYALAEGDEVLLVIEGWKQSRPVLRKAVELSKYSTDQEGWNYVHMYARAQHLGLGEEGQRIRIYLWNPHKSSIYFDNLEFRVERGNPLLYGLVEEIPHYLK